MATAAQKKMVATMLAEHTPVNAGYTVSIIFVPFKGDVFGSTVEPSGIYGYMYNDYPVLSYDNKTGMYIIRDDDGQPQKIPFYCIKLAKRNDGRTFFLANEDAKINTTGTVIDVGCQSVKFEEVKMVYEAMLALQKKKVSAKASTKKAPAKKKIR